MRNLILSILLVATIACSFCQALSEISECYYKLDKGASYRGDARRTISGKLCQRWDSQSPHSHSRTAQNYPNSGLVDNFCRNPDGEEAPWCYTEDSGTRWEYCPVKECSDGCYKKSDKGESYRGTTSKTVTGKNCQRWDSQSPHGHTRTAENYPNSGLDEDFCRNPDGEGAPWCYTTDAESRWEYCTVLPCSAECWNKQDKGANYRGIKRTTKSGKKCQRWSEQFPHSHTRTPENYPDSGLDDNYCRNPDNEDSPWCYTTDSESRWEYCDVIPCAEECYNGDGAGYRGAKAVTNTGKMCQAWNAQTPHSHGNTPEDHPTSGLDENFCRNPDGEPSPWCYTMDGSSRWEPCSILPCSTGCYNVDNKGTTYRGTVSHSVTGRTCQRWNKQAPHKHGNTPEMYPDAGLDENYCRNPDPDKSGAPWCYTIDSGSRWEYCLIPPCA